MAKLAVRPKIDLAFKKIFSENEEILKSLLSAALNIPVSAIQELKVENTEIMPDYLENKFCRLDLKATMNGRIIDVEIQLNNLGNFQARALYYWSLLFSKSLKSGNDYDLLPQTIVISFIDFNLFGTSDYHSHFVLKENTRNEILTDKLAIYFFELKKIPKLLNENKKIELWLKLIGAETEEEIKELENMENGDIKIALDEVKRLNADEIFKKQIELREKTLLEETSALNFAKREGYKEGREEEREAIIKSMRENGLSDKDIEKILKYNKIIL